MPLQKGAQAGTILNQIRAKLLLLGDLDEKDSFSSDTFDDKLKKAIIAFQKRYFINTDGVIGRKTCALINDSWDKLIQKIKGNIKRLKELPIKGHKRFIMVNIPMYELMLIDKGQVVQSQKVVVGTCKTKTPLMTTHLTGITLNPVWHVPLSIFFRSKIEFIRADPHYLPRFNYVVKNQDGEDVSADTIDWATISKIYFPYSVEQLPGRNNALGVIRFNLDNKYHVYIHDTNSRETFNEIRRDLSSGCIRVVGPLKMAKWVFEGTKWGNETYLQKKIDTQKTQVIPLKKPITVHVVYITTWVNDQGKLKVNDPYHYD